MDPAEPIRVDVVYSPQAGECDLVTLSLSPGSTLADALAASGLLERHPLPAEGLRLGVWSKLREPDTLLRNGDRVEVYRTLKVDPKEARRQRYQQHRESQVASEKSKAAKLAGAGAGADAAALTCSPKR